MTRERRRVTHSAVQYTIASVITAVWVASYGLGLFDHSYHPPPELNSTMLLVAGFFYGWAATPRRPPPGRRSRR